MGETGATSKETSELSGTVSTTTEAQESELSGGTRDRDQKGEGVARNVACECARTQLTVIGRELQLVPDETSNRDEGLPIGLFLLGAVLAVLIVVGVAFFEWSEPGFVAPSSDWWWLVFGVAALLAVFLLFARLRSNPNGPSTTESLGASLLGACPIMIGLAGTVTVGLYLWPLSHYHLFEGWGHYAALLGGVASALVFGLIVAFSTIDVTGPKEIHPRVYGELASIYHGLSASVNVYCPNAVGVAENGSGQPRLSWKSGASDSTRFPGEMSHTPLKVSARWVLGTGYIDMWNRIHAVEEALFLIKPDEDVASDGIYDEMRLKDSNINNSVDYAGKLRLAIVALGAGDYLSTPPTKPTVSQKVESADDRLQARMILRGVRHAINQYRDSRREGLVRTRNNLMLTGCITGVLALLLLSLVILRRIEDSTLVAAIAFYLVGAIVGLFNQMNSGWGKAGETEEDYGLTQARVLYTPMLSGLAAVGGVLVTSLLSATLLTTSPADLAETADSLAVATPTNGQEATSQLDLRTRYARVPTLGEIFDLEDVPFSIVAAAVFGLTPGLLVDRLKGEGEKYKADIQSTDAQGNR